MASTENKLNGNAHDAEEIIEKSASISNKDDPSEQTKKTVEKPEEITKRTIRKDTWKKIQDKKLLAVPGTVFNRIPNFIGAERAAELLSLTDEFKKAKNVKVDIDRSQDSAKVQTINASKNLYISTGRESSAIYAKVNCPADEDIEVKKKAILVTHLAIYGSEIDFLNKVELDLVIIGSVAVSKSGQRIGRGNGYVDLDFALLKHCGSITDKTLVVTVVHDEQVYDTLPNELFTSYDVPIDIIVTPTEVIRVAKRLPRPEGIQWAILSERRLGVVPVLKEIKEHEEKNGKIIVLKEEDTDVETNRRPRNFRRYFQRPRKSRTNTENNGETNEDGTEASKPRRRFRKNNKKTKKATAEDGEQSGTEKKTPNKSKKQRKHEDDLDDELEPFEVTKRSLRLKTWKKVAERRSAPPPFYIYNRVPNFNGAAKAATLLSEIDEFKNAKNIKVNSDKAQDPVKIKVLTASKNLYVAAQRQSTALYSKINCEADAETELLKKSIRLQNLAEYGTDIELQDKIELDMLVLGAVAVSRSGQRIGRGNGYVDLDFGILVKSGSVTDKTVIVATVHDDQIYDSLPDELFTEYDVPIDIIVTATEVIRVEKRLPRPTGIFWNLLSERRLNIVPVLKTIKENEEKDGKLIVLKAEDTDIDSDNNRQKKRRNNRNRRRSARSGDDGDNAEESQNVDRRRRKINRRNKKSKAPNTDGELSGNENPTKRTPKKRRGQSDFCLKVSNIPRSIRMKEFKTELRERGCNPLYISWKGVYGCFLHYNKQNADDDEETAVKDMINALEKFTFKDTNAGDETSEAPVTESKLKIDIVKRAPENRIEIVDVTSV